jgi:hypothetical protein
MSFLTKNLRTRVQEEDVSEEGNDYENDENKCDVKPAKAAFRGCTAALLANLNDDSDDSGEDSDESPSLSKKAGKGIYAMKLSQTKREIKETHNQFDMADSKQLFAYLLLIKFSKLFAYKRKTFKKRCQYEANKGK